LDQNIGEPNFLMDGVVNILFTTIFDWYYP